MYDDVILLDPKKNRFSAKEGGKKQGKKGDNRASLLFSPPPASSTSWPSLRVACCDAAPSAGRACGPASAVAVVGIAVRGATEVTRGENDADGDAPQTRRLSFARLTEEGAEGRRGVSWASPNRETAFSPRQSCPSFGLGGDEIGYHTGELRGTPLNLRKFPFPARMRRARHGLSSLRRL
jgi:hypothetical protein